MLEKPELSKVLQNRRETQRRKEWEEQASSKRTSLEMKLEQRATRLKVKYTNCHGQYSLKSTKQYNFEQFITHVT